MKLQHALFAVTLVFVTTVLSEPVPVKSIFQTAKQPYQRRGDEGSIRGTVFLTGRPPANPRIDQSADPACVARNPRARTEWIVGRKGRLAGVFVYIKTGAPLDEYSFAAATPRVVLDQQGCRFIPHVLGMQTSQTLEVRNSDPTTHNVHGTPKLNPEWNQSQPAGGTPLIMKFGHSELMVPIKCNQHPWMKAYVGVLSHPFFAVSDRNGAFTIEGLPPGNYTLGTWHEKFEDRTIDVTITSSSNQTVSFSFNSKDQRAWH
jgi:plastocyanin